ncbi:UDP-glucuronosyltransferase 2A3 [Tupaia chinensis]|uniref:UDP-glucuronosyltransferase 2A3 n=1 Tax=Tupaia chinensis TaxID=246437 RepID=UPI0003C90DAE|nr:UDP-glucuronosyltransferase 2A3 [Tupaia chinensis]XP_006163639.1 UDP-glucuronosyltransferase 2A3 [Tupaia chinensis]XP_006163640.1 UDP-glucuronosyltransferase 2A3 [Tupaia chinensis]XP_014437648.1 UDP-glucuronosyltransferase 2A3 [Tupaia chinensis]
MGSEKWVMILLLLCCAGCGFCGKVLVWPCDMSHWLNLKIILEELIARSHEVTVIIPSHTFLIDYRKSSALNFEVFHVPQGKEFTDDISKKFMDLAVNVLPNLPSWQSAIKLNNFFAGYNQQFKLLCESVVYNQTLMKKLQETNYDVMIIDPVVPCGELLAELLAVPFVITLKSSIGGNIEKYCGKLPSPPSYVPVHMVGLTDRMTFLERVKNTLSFVFFNLWIQYYDFHFWKQFYSTVLGRPTTLCETLGKAEIWLMRTYWDSEFPHPYFPNFQFVGGLHCKPAKPLPKEMEEFVHSSGEDGILVFSLGSFIYNLTDEKANLIASALAQVPQKVLWRYSGKKPATLAANTRIYDWIPQNDLLGHPKTKAFITHGGINGIYEAIYHGVPMVGIPLFSDQPDNIANMKAKGAAVEVNWNTMTSADLLRALRTITNDPSYKENAMRLSRIHHDQPMKPLDRAVFWIEFVMRHKGAKHLRSAAHDLTWFQYHSLDVIGFLLGCAAIAIFLVAKCFLFFCHKFGNIRIKKKRD